MDPELQQIKTSLGALERAGLLKAQPSRSRAFMIECLSLVGAHLPPELFVVLRSLQNPAQELVDVADARLGCWKHLEACACYGSGIESGAVRALLMLLEQTDAADAARLADFVRLVQV